MTLNNKIGVILLTLLMIMPNKALATYLEEIQGLGYIAGTGLACGAKNYPKYEFIARVYLITKAKSDKEQNEGMYEYNKAKVEGYLSKKEMNLLGCDSTNESFNRQMIFKTTIYKKGKIKLPDGTIIKPRRPYDVMKVYRTDGKEKEEIDAYYNMINLKRIKKAEKEGIFQKIRQEEQKASYNR